LNISLYEYICRELDSTALKVLRAVDRKAKLADNKAQITDAYREFVS